MKSIQLILIALLLFSCNNEENKSEIKKTFVMSDKMLNTTQFATATLQNVKNQLNFFGTITAENNKTIEIFPVASGNVTGVFVELGDYVEQGALLATVRSSEIAAFEKEMTDAKNDALLAKNKLMITNDLFEGKLNTEREVIQAKSELEKAESQLNRVQENYKIFNIKKEATYEIKSPLSGFITSKNINQGMLIRTDNASKIFDIAQINEVWAIANINESDIGKVKEGMEAEVTTLSYPDKKFYGKIDKLYNIIDPETKALKARVKLQNENNMLKPEMNASIKIVYAEEKKMLAVPSGALVFDKSKNFVMVFNDKNNIETRQVEVVSQVGDLVYLNSGLKEGEKVLVTNQLLVYDALND